MARHTMDNVPPPTIMREAVPDELEDVIMRAMAKTPADRFQTGMEMVEALEMVDIHTAIHRRPSVAQRRSSMMQRMPEVERPFWKRPMVWGAAAGIGAVAVVSGILAVGMVGPRPGVAAAGGGLDPRSIAVLYFEDLSPTEDLAHLADGLTEGLISELARLQGLHVVSANAVAAYRESDVPMDSIGRALQTGTLVVGSVAPDRGGRITVTTRLVDGATGGDVGRRQTFTLPADQLLSAPDSVARSVSLILREWLGEEVALARTRAATSNEAAWVAFQRAEKLRKDAEASLAAGADDARALLTRADSLYAEAEAADRRWVDPVVGRGWAVYRRARLERSEEARWLLDALGHAERALALNPGSGAALELRGVIRFRRYELDPNQPEWRSLLFGAKEDLEAAVRADPTLARAYVVLSYVLYQPQIDDVPGALLAARTGYERDAYLRGVDDLIERLFWGNLDLENFTEARRWCDTGAQRFPSSPVFVRCQLWLMATPAVAADPQRAATLIARLDTLLGSSAAAPYYKAEAQVVLGGILGRAGLPDSAQNVLQRVQRSITFEIDPDQELPGRIAYMYTLSGDFDTAIDLLKRYVAANPHHGFLEQAGTVWWWRGIRNHPRYREIEMAGQGR
jgi:TolB-like protein